MTRPVDMAGSPVNQVVERLQGMIDSALPVYLLIDPLGGEPAGIIDSSAEDLLPQRQQVWERHIIQVRLGSRITLPARQHPYLVKLRGPDDPVVELALVLAEEERLAAQSGGFGGSGSAGHALGGWLQSALPEAELSTALSTLCRVNTAAATRATYLRAADRRVLGWLCHIVGNERVASHLKGIAKWIYLDPWGEVRHLRCAQEQSQALRLSAQEWRRLARSERLNRTLSTSLGVQAAASAMSDQVGYDAVENAVLAAELAAKQWPHRFHSSHDEITWAALSICHPALPHLPDVRALMAGTGSLEDPPESVRYLVGDLLGLLKRAQVGASSV